MTPNLTKYVNKTIFVSIPPLSGDLKCRPYKLTGVELIGLWLESADLTNGFLTKEHAAHTSTTWAFFVPYSQIACVCVGTTPPIPAGGTPPTAQNQGPAQQRTAASGASPTGGTAATGKKAKPKER
jgi:hypothetical protein